LDLEPIELASGRRGRGEGFHGAVTGEGLSGLPGGIGQVVLVLNNIAAAIERLEGEDEVVAADAGGGNDTAASGIGAGGGLEGQLEALAETTAVAFVGGDGGAVLDSDRGAGAGTVEVAVDEVHALLPLIETGFEIDAHPGRAVVGGTPFDVEDTIGSGAAGAGEDAGGAGREVGS